MTRINATNQTGWSVQWLSSNEWEYVTDELDTPAVFATEQEAREVCEGFLGQWTEHEYRVYPMLSDNHIEDNNG